MVGVSVVLSFGLTVELFGDDGERGDLGGGPLADEVGLDDIPPIQLVLLALNIYPHERPLHHIIIILKLTPLRAFIWRSDYFRHMKPQYSISQFYGPVLLIFNDKSYIFLLVRHDIKDIPPCSGPHLGHLQSLPSGLAVKTRGEILP